jgi:hypothetical protein
MLTLLSLALAITPDDVDDRIRSVDNLSLSRDLYRRVERPVVFADGAVKVRLTSGVMVPIFSGRFEGEWDRKAGALLRRLREEDPRAVLPDSEQRGRRELVGFVWLDGEGVLSVEMDRADAMRHASRQVLLAGADAETLGPLGRGEARFDTQVSRGLFLSADPSIGALFLGDTTSDPYEVVVYPDRDDLSGARALLTRRLELWEDTGLDWSRRIGRDRVAAELGELARPDVLIDLFTEQRYHHVSMLPDPGDDRWLAYIRDDRGTGSPRWNTRVVSAGRRPDGRAAAVRIAGTRFSTTDPSDPTSSPAPVAGVTPVFARGLVTVQPRSNGLELDADFHLTLTLRARTTTTVFELELPRVEAVPRAFALRSATVDGRSVVAEAQIGRTRDRLVKTVRVSDGSGGAKEIERVDGSRVRVVLPTPLPAGESADLVLEWSDAWPYACQISGDPTSGVRRFLPELEGHPLGGPWDYQVTVAVPAASKLRAAVSGDTEKTWTQEGFRLQRTVRTENARWPTIVVGKYHHARDEAPQGDLPDVDTFLHTAYPGHLDATGPEIWRSARFLKGYLPSLPQRELDVVTPRSRCRTPWFPPSYGMVWLTEGAIPFPRPGRPLNGEHRLPTQSVIRQYFGQLAYPASPDDGWVMEVLAELYSCLYLEHAIDQRGLCDNIVEKQRRWARRPLRDARRTRSLTEAYTARDLRAVQQYGMVVLSRMLIARIGRTEFHQAIDVLLREHAGEPLTTERLQKVFEETSGRDLQDFFDFWIRQGIVPSVTVELVAHPGGHRGIVRSNVPFGTFDVQVLLEDGEEMTKSLWVTVTDGAGRFEVTGMSDPVVTIDPENRTLLR